MIRFIAWTVAFAVELALVVGALDGMNKGELVPLAGWLIVVLTVVVLMWTVRRLSAVAHSLVQRATLLGRVEKHWAGAATFIHLGGLVGVHLAGRRDDLAHVTDKFCMKGLDVFDETRGNTRLSDGEVDFLLSSINQSV